VASLLSAIAAELFISALTITSEDIATAPELFIDISPDTAVGLKFVPSAIRSIPLVFVPMVRSSPDIVRSPAMVTLAPLKVSAVVEPDFMIRFPEELVKAAY